MSNELPDVEVVITADSSKFDSTLRAPRPGIHMSLSDTLSLFQSMLGSQVVTPNFKKVAE